MSLETLSTVKFTWKSLNNFSAHLSKSKLKDKKKLPLLVTTGFKKVTSRLRDLSASKQLTSLLITSSQFSKFLVASSNLVCMQYLSNSSYQMQFQVQSTSKSAKLVTGAKPRLSILLRLPFIQLKSNMR